jgi:phosphatidate cytidylyltransferase
MLGSMIMAYLSSDMNMWTTVSLAFVVVIFGTLGDLYQSQVKRLYEVKDSGKIMPGHGGIWDRFDSFVFILPFYTIILNLLNK